FDEQRGYADYMLREVNAPEATVRRRPKWPWYPGADLPLRAKKKVLDLVWISSFAVVILVHLGILVSRAGGWTAFEGIRADMVIIIAALLAIAAKTLSEGFALKREIERYEEYQSVVNGLRLAFRAASSMRRKVSIMMDMER